MKKLTLILLLVCMLPKGTYGQTTDDALLRNRLESYFSHYKPIGAQFSRRAHLSACEIDTTERNIRILANETFAEQAFTPQSVERIEQEVRKLLVGQYADYSFSILTHNRDIHELIPNRLREKTG